jgi:hypothetical protein
MPTEPPAAPTVEQLLDMERTALELRLSVARKAEAVRRTFGLSLARYTQLLRPVVLGDGEEHRRALESDALLTHQLADRWRARMARRAALITRGASTWE